MSSTIFTWPRRQGSSWTLAGCIFLTLFLHSSAFFIFQAALPGPSTAPRTAPPLQVLTPYAPDGSLSAENEALLRWIDAEDPAAIARVPTVEPANLLLIPYRPSFATPRTPPLTAPEEPATIQFPPAREPLSVILGSNRSRPAIAGARIDLQPTRIEFSTPLKSRAPKVPRFTPPTVAKKPVAPTSYLIGINAEGTVHFSFLEQASGEPLLDGAAEVSLPALRFAPAKNAIITWGTATFHWGDDAMEKAE